MINRQKSDSKVQQVPEEKKISYPLSRETVVNAFKFILGRDPEVEARNSDSKKARRAEEGILQHMKLKDVSTLIEVLLNSVEFRGSTRFKGIIRPIDKKTDKYIKHNNHLYGVPVDLSKKDCALSNILIIGSCLSESLLNRINYYISENKLEISADHLLVNNISKLPEEAPRPIGDYSFQIIQPPLRRVLHESLYFRNDLLDSDKISQIYEESVQRLKFFLNNYLEYNKKYQLTTFVCNFIVPQQNPLGKLLPKNRLSNLQYFIREINREMEEMLSAYKNTYLLDLDEIASLIGKKHILDDSLHVTSHGALSGDFDFGHDRKRLHPPEPFSKHHELKGAEFLDAVWHTALAQYKTIIQQDQVKIVIFDLDDTLWRGIVAEEGIHPPGLEGWPMGLLEAILFLKKRGILLAIASKNSEEIIQKQWNDIFHGLLLFDDFAVTKINWNSKSQSIREILAETNLLPSNALFIDDNPAERENVQKEFPEIRTLGADLYYIRRILLWAPELQVAKITNESAARTEMMKAGLKRDSLRDSMSREEFIESLGLVIEECKITGQENESYDRAYELLNKTNQFNTTGKRWTPEECARLFQSGGYFHTFKVQDKFTTYGLVGVLVIEGNCIRQFVMSCRVVGLDVENKVLASVVAGIGAPLITAEYIKTDKNHLCTELYQENGFDLIEGVWTFRKN